MTRVQWGLTKLGRDRVGQPFDCTSFQDQCLEDGRWD
jgi:hypothetical protein